MNNLSGGFFGVAMFNTKKEVNYGSLCRSAAIFGAAIIYMIGKRFRTTASDTVASYRHVPLIQVSAFQEFYQIMPYDSCLIGVELSDDAMPIESFLPPKRAVYLFGAEDHGIPNNILARCHKTVRLCGKYSMNLACAGSIVLHHHIVNQKSRVVLGETN